MNSSMAEGSYEPTETSRLGGGRTTARGSPVDQGRVSLLRVLEDTLVGRRKHVESITSRIHVVCDALSGPVPTAAEAAGTRQTEDRSAGVLFRLRLADDGLAYALHELEEAIDRLENTGVA
jgi:hypothetical protein